MIADTSTQYMYRLYIAGVIDGSCLLFLCIISLGLLASFCKHIIVLPFIHFLLAYMDCGLYSCVGVSGIMMLCTKSYMQYCFVSVFPRRLASKFRIHHPL